VISSGDGGGGGGGATFVNSAYVGDAGISHLKQTVQRNLGFHHKRPERL